MKTNLIIFVLIAINESKYLNYTLFKHPIKSSVSQNQSDISIEQCTPPSTNNNLNISLGDCSTHFYYIKLGLGTPPQYFYYQFDTGSNIMWIPTIQALNKGFNVNQSSTYSVTNQRYQITYADGSGVYGNVGSDVISVLGTSINVSNQVLFVYKEVDMHFPGNITGLVGMGYTDLPNFLDAAYTAGQISTNIFALQLQSQSQQSILYYDTIPQSISSKTLNSSIYGSGFWQLHVIAVHVGEGQNDDWTQYSVSYAVIDSGTSLFYLNPSFYNHFVSTYLSLCLIDSAGFICLCDQINLPAITFGFPGVAVQILAEDYVIPLGDNQCQVIINELADQSDILLLGDTLFLNYIVTFNKQERTVGFAGKQNGIQPIPINIVANGQWFVTGGWVMMAIGIILFVAYLFLIYHLRIIDQSKLRRKMLASQQTSWQYNQQLQNIEHKHEINNY